MNFLVILICLTINYLWLKDFDRFDDGWFFRFRCRIEEATQSLAERSSRVWLVNLLLIYGGPMLLLGAMVLLVDGRAYGVPTMLLHMLVLLIAFDRTQPGKLASDFLDKWDLGDFQGAKLYLQQELNSPELESLENEQNLLDYFCRQLIYRCFEKMFVMFFWYMLTGPLGILFNYISYQLRDSHREGQAQELVETVSTVIGLLEWVPMRLLALTFSLAGNFVQCFDNVKQSFWSFSLDSNNAALLYSYSGCALSGAGASDADAMGEDTVTNTVIKQGASRIGGLQALLERSQAIWLAVLAMITVFGL